MGRCVCQNTLGLSSFVVSNKDLLQIDTVLSTLLDTQSDLVYGQCACALFNF